MIQANELRIGNWFQDPLGNYFRVAGIRFKTIYTDTGSKAYARMKPIPLTPEILEKCGAVALPNKFDGSLSCLIVNKNVGIVYFRNGLIGVTTIINEDGELTQKTTSFYEHIQSLHQLQNLYFDLAGQELTIKL